MYIPEIPNNSLTEEIKEIVELSKKLEKEYDFEYAPPATEKEISAWESEHGITIPETYKDWLRFSNGSFILFDLMTTCDLEHISIDSEIVPDNLIVIGTLIGDGELLCFSKNTGKIIWFDDGRTEEYDDLKPILLRIINLMQGKSGVSQSSINVLMNMYQNTNKENNK